MISLAQGTYYFSNPNGDAVDLQSSLGFSIAAGSTAYFNGQFYVVNFNNAGSVTFNAGTYVFDGAASLPGTSVAFSGGTYFFENGSASPTIRASLSPGHLIISSAAH